MGVICKMKKSFEWESRHQVVGVNVRALRKLGLPLEKCVGLPKGLTLYGLCIRSLRHLGLPMYECVRFVNMAMFWQEGERLDAVVDNPFGDWGFEFGVWCTR